MTTGASTRLATNAGGSQVNGYHQGNGFKYTRHTFSGGIDSYVTAVRSNSIPASDIQEDGYRTDIREASIYNNYIGQVWKGYFHASVAGQYTFRAWADDRVKVFLASTYGDATPLTDSDLIISTSTHQYSDSYYVKDQGNEGEVVRTLEAGKSYYMEVYHFNSFGAGFIKF